jgi:hypothetical protein
MKTERRKRGAGRQGIADIYWILYSLILHFHRVRLSSASCLPFYYRGGKAKAVFKKVSSKVMNFFNNASGNLHSN